MTASFPSPIQLVQANDQAVAAIHDRFPGFVCGRRDHPCEYHQGVQDALHVFSHQMTANVNISADENTDPVVIVSKLLLLGVAWCDAVGVNTGDWGEP